LIFLAGYQVTDDTAKITTTLSFMRGGYADEFVQETVNLASTDPSVLNWGTWAEFIKRLDNRFKDKNFTQSAREKLEHFQQGKMLVDTYITQLESLFTDAGFATATASTEPAVIAANAAIDAEKIRILEKSVNNNILETIYTSDSPIPTTYNAYKDKILQLGRLRERYRQFKGITTPSSSSSTTHTPQQPKPPAHQFHTHIHPPADKKTGTGITYGGAGQPMDIGKTRQKLRCFNCGELGHMRRECPNEKKVDIRALMVGLEEELAELKIEVESQESDFMDGR
jgi:Zinc knuckle/Retrotransposon gag protein